MSSTTLNIQNIEGGPAVNIPVTMLPPRSETDDSRPDTQEKKESASLGNSMSNPISTSEDRTNLYLHGWTLGIVIVSLTLGVFLVALDATIIGVAIPKITSDFKDLDDIAWFGSVYLLMITAFQPSFGSLYKFFNVKYVGSTLCAASPSPRLFILGRAIAGLGAAGVYQGAIAIVGYTVVLEKRPLYLGLVVSSFTISACIAPALGGALTDHAPYIIAGTMLSTVGCGLLTTITLDTSTFIWAAFEIIIGMGLGLAMQLPYTALQIVLNEADLATANAVAVFFNQLGGALGLSISQALLLTSLQTNIPLLVPSISPEAIIKTGAVNLDRLTTDPAVLLEIRGAWGAAVRVIFKFVLTASAMSIPFAALLEQLNVHAVSKRRQPATNENAIECLALLLTVGGSKYRTPTQQITWIIQCHTMLSKKEEYLLIALSNLLPVRTFQKLSGLLVLSNAINNICPFAVRSGRHHNIVGIANIHRGITIDLRNITQTTTRPDKRLYIVHVVIGASWGSVYSTLGLKG
ncbi:hypothetical protein NHQ30_006768 [Ciborinia camelliae]|nr:hypothetical protein NHQ30_006768 [Ciborinia camelliae]